MAQAARNNLRHILLTYFPCYFVASLNFIFTPKFQNIVAICLICDANTNIFFNSTSRPAWLSE